MQARSYMLQNKEKHPIPPCTVFMSDSMSALHMLKKHSNELHLANQCITVLKTLSLHTKVTLCWIKAHVGNEKADELAAFGALYASPGMDAIEATVLDEIPAPYSHLVILVRKGTEKS